MFDFLNVSDTNTLRCVLFVVLGLFCFSTAIVVYAAYIFFKTAASIREDVNNIKRELAFAIDRTGALRTSLMVVGDYIALTNVLLYINHALDRNHTLVVVVVPSPAMNTIRVYMENDAGVKLTPDTEFLAFNETFVGRNNFAEYVVDNLFALHDEKHPEDCYVTNVRISRNLFGFGKAFAFRRSDDNPEIHLWVDANGDVVE